MCTTIDGSRESLSHSALLHRGCQILNMHNAPRSCSHVVGVLWLRTIVFAVYLGLCIVWNGGRDNDTCKLEDIDERRLGMEALCYHGNNTWSDGLVAATCTDATAPVVMRRTCVCPSHLFSVTVIFLAVRIVRITGLGTVRLQ